jgi:predicted nucleic acid-binding protein
VNIVDSSGWLEYFADDSNADFFAPAIEDIDHLLVPVICVYEVFKRILQLKGLDIAETRITDLFKGQLLDLTSSDALSAAIISNELKIPMADSFILAAARAHNATLWTQDEHFKDISGIQYIEKQ